VTASSIADTTKSSSATLTVPAAPVITNSSLAAGAVGTAYSAQLAASGGIPPYAFTVNSGTLPSCLTITAAGLISGTPTASCAGGASLTFKVTDSGKATALTAVSGSLSLVIAAAPVIVLPAPATLVAGTYNQAYTGTVAASGGAGTLTYSVAAGALPTGLSLTSAGAITGTPTATGTFGFTIKAADAYGDSATQAYSVSVSYSPVKVAAATLPTGYVGSTYLQITLAATGGSGKGYSWALSNGSSLPAGLSLSAGGVITGTPTGTPGTTNFSVTVTDSAQNTGNGSFSITVDAGVSITTSSPLTTGYVGSSYSKQLAATGGTGTGYTWAVASGSTLPGGLTLSSGGLLSGTPTTIGTPSFSVTVTDSAQNTANATFSLTIDAGVTVTPAVLPIGYPGTIYPSTTLSAIGGTGAGYTWSWAAASGSTLPAGLSLSAAGVITGTPVNATSSSVVSNVVITAKDSAGNTGSANFTVTIEATLAVVTAATLPNGVVNVAYSQILAATGGSGGYSWATNNAGTTSLATVNLTLNASGLVAGTPSGTGSATFAATVTDSASHTATVTFTVTVTNALTIITTTLPAGYTGTAYSQTLSAGGGSGTGYTWAATSSNLATYGLSLSSAGVLSGTPSTSGAASFTAKVTDSASNTATQPLTVTIYAQLALPAPNPSSLPSAVENHSYNGSVSATGGVSPYSWTVDGQVIPTNSTPVSISNGISVSNNGSNVLSVSGTPTTTSTITLTTSVTDSASNTAGPDAYTVSVNTNSQVSGQIGLVNSCGVSTLPTFNVSINTNPVQNTTTDSNGNYSFASVPNGTYTITPSISGPGSAFYPATLTNVVVSNSSLTGENFQANVGYTVSGAVSYAGAKTGQVFITLSNSNCGGNNPNGTSITEATLTSGGAFTVRGVPPGSYTLQALMDHLGNGAANATDPTGSGSVTVSTANVTGADVTINDQSVTTPSSGPSINAIIPGNLGVVISYKALTNSNGVETVGGYTVEWSTDSSFGSTSSYSYAAIGTNSNVWILNNGLVNMTGSFTNGTAYYFRARGELSNGTIHTPWTVYGGGTPTAVIVGALSGSGYDTISGAVTIPSTITPTGPLYVGFYNQSNGDVHATYIASPSNSTANAYTVAVPAGSGYIFFGILDQNNDGLIDAGDVTNTRDNGNPATVTISGNMTGEDLTLPTADSTAAVTTQFLQSTSSGGTSTSYDVVFDLREADKLPVSVTLASASNPNVVTPVDIGVCGSSCNNQQWQYYTSIGSDVPSLGDTYTFDVTYSDATTGTVTAAVTAVLTSSNAPANLAPNGTSSTSTTPTFTWTDPASASSYTYQFYISDNTGNTIWQIPGNNSNSNGFASTITSIVWGTDPTGDSSNTPSVGSLTTGTTYTWQIQLQDSNGNQAATQVSYTP
jgi:hypothetical protein